MARQGSEPINALVRGLKVLAALNDLNDGSVGDLARTSGVAKTTVIRRAVDREKRVRIESREKNTQK